MRRDRARHGRAGILAGGPKACRGNGRRGARRAESHAPRRARSYPECAAARACRAARTCCAAPPRPADCVASRRQRPPAAAWRRRERGAVLSASRWRNQHWVVSVVCGAARHAREGTATNRRAEGGRMRCVPAFLRAAPSPRCGVPAQRPPCRASSRASSTTRAARGAETTSKWKTSSRTALRRRCWLRTTLPWRASCCVASRLRRWTGASGTACHARPLRGASVHALLSADAHCAVDSGERPLLLALLRNKNGVEVLELLIAAGAVLTRAAAPAPRKRRLKVAHSELSGSRATRHAAA